MSGLPSEPALALEAVKNDQVDFWPEGRQACWADGSLRSVGFQTILPPGSPSATSDKGELEGVMSASSYHLADGAHALFADGHIRFIRSSIDAGDPSRPSVADQPGLTPPKSPSPYGVWGALGTRLGAEKFDGSGPSIAPPPFELDDDELKKITSKRPRIWTASNEMSTVKAWYVDIIDKSIVLLLFEDRQIRPIPLTMLSSKDAYLAVEKHSQAELQEYRVCRQATKTVHADLKRAAALLKSGRYGLFIQQFLHIPPEEIRKSNMSEKQVLAHWAKATASEQDRFLTEISAAVQWVDLVEKSGGALEFDDSGTSVQIRGRTQSANVSMRLIRADRTWKLDLRGR